MILFTLHVSSSSGPTVPASTSTLPLMVQAFSPYHRSHKCTAALQYQIFIFNDNDETNAMDYMLLAPSGSSVGVGMPHLPLKSQFRKFRDIAVCTGDRKAVAIIAQCLSVWTVAELRTDAPVLVTSDEYTSEVVLEQLNKEYGFRVDLAVADLEKQRMRHPEALVELEKATETFLEEGVKMFRNPALVEKRNLLLAKVQAQLAAGSKI
ncbi:hypothetical protein PLICRDRAFT_87694 [Plicaturopsis crispa FD-325 SS-3]|nr:hypothetical protein PLICRDRAFT_87694 [Plicaturopsis crispa FD-325 SS-3]